MDSGNRGPGRESLVVSGKDAGSRNANFCSFAETQWQMLQYR